MDPRSFTVKPCPGPYAAKSAADISSAGSLRRDFANSIGKIGDLQVLNSIGGGSVGQGLRTMAHVSNSIRTGCGSLPSIIGSSLDQGANWVLENIGIAPTMIQALKNFNPAIANQAWGQAQQIYTHIKSGTFKSTDIPYYLQDLQNLERLARGIYTPGNDRLNALSPVCEASPYAMDLIARAPKYKFLFVVQFTTAPGYNTLDSILRGMAFVVKKSTRPKVTYETEDVNYYNFRTKVLTKAVFEEMNMSFHDDVLNNSTQFYVAYMRAMSPITNMPPTSSPTHGTFESLGLDYVNNTLALPRATTDLPIATSKYASSMGVLANDNKQSIFKEITLYHVFDAGNQVTVYHFLNPRVNQLMPDDLDMSVGNEGTELSMNFVYDSVYIETVSMKQLDGVFRAAQSDAVYQLRYNDAASAVRGPNASGISPYGSPVGSSSSCNSMNPINTAGSSNVDSMIIGGGFGGGLNQGLGDFLTTK